MELEADLEVCNGVGRHQQLVAVQTGQQVFRDIGIPLCLDGFLPLALFLPKGNHGLVDQVNDLHQEGAGAGGGVENLDEGLMGWRAVGNPQAVVALRHGAPSGGVGETMGEAKLCAQQPIHRAHNGRHHKPRCVEDASTHPLRLVVGGEEVLVKVDGRVVLRVAGAKVTDHCRHIHLIQQFHHLGDARRFPADTEHQLLQERIGAHMGSKGVGYRPCGVGDAD